MKRYIDAKRLEFELCESNMPQRYRDFCCRVINDENLTPTADVTEIRHSKNITKMHPVDEFICSECGLILRDLTEVRIDEENEDECYYEFEVKYCPYCGAKIGGAGR